LNVAGTRASVEPPEEPPAVEPPPDPDPDPEAPPEDEPVMPPPVGAVVVGCREAVVVVAGCGLLAAVEPRVVPAGAVVVAGAVCAALVLGCEEPPHPVIARKAARAAKRPSGRFTFSA
jgi:hypothetical protein